MSGQPALLHAFIDESGQRAKTKASSDHFVMTAVVVADENLPKVAPLLAQIRKDVNRNPGDTLHWNQVKGHPQRLHIAQTLGTQEWLTISSVVVCKRHLTSGDPMDDDSAYLYTLRYLLERLSWLARDRGRELHYTLAHIVRFQIAKLREYEAKLKTDYGCQIAWKHLDPRGGRIDQPSRVEYLQLADAAASATATAFNSDNYGNTEDRYLRELSPRLYRRGLAPVTSYGLKMHPWNDTTKATYPWVAAL